MHSVKVKRHRLRFSGDSSRVIARFFPPGDTDHVKRLLKRAMALSEEECTRTLDEVKEGFSDRHHELDRILLENYSVVEHYIDSSSRLSDDQKCLIGAYFTISRQSGAVVSDKGMALFSRKVGGKVCDARLSGRGESFHHAI